MGEHDTSTWRKSTFSRNGDCVECSCGGNLIYVRSSRSLSAGALGFSYVKWDAFISTIKSENLSCRENTQNLGNAR
jgi:uncharacterized protein DUF397